MSQNMLSGVQVVVSCAMPTHKTMAWRNERKWCHRVMHQRAIAHKVRTKQVPCYDVIRVGNTLWVNQATFDRLSAEVPLLDAMGRTQ